MTKNIDEFAKNQTKSKINWTFVVLFILVVIAIYLFYREYARFTLQRQETIIKCREASTYYREIPEFSFTLSSNRMYRKEEVLNETDYKSCLKDSGIELP